MVLLRAFDLGTVFFDGLRLSPVTVPFSLRLYPADYGRGGVWPLVRGAPNFVRVMLMGDRSRFRTASILLDLPPGVGEFGLLGQGTPVSQGGKTFTRYRVPVSDELLKSLDRTVSHCALTLWLDAQQAEEGAVAGVQAAADELVLEARQVPLRLLPGLPEGPRPRSYRGLFCWGLFGDVPEGLWPRVYDMVRGMGVSHLLASPATQGWTGYLQDRLRADGGQLWANVPHAAETMAYGKSAETRIIAAGRDAFRPHEEHYRRLLPLVDGVFWDWEPPNARQNPLWDDPPTVAAFAARENLDPASVTPDRLQADLRERFLAFRTWQLGEVLRLWAASVRELRSDLVIAVCQGSGMPPDRHLDYKAYDDIPNLIHLPMVYTASPMDFARNVAALREYLPRSTLWPMTSTSMVADNATPAAKSPRSIYFDYLTPALLGAVGCSHWPDLARGMDMEYVWEVSHAMRDLGAVERFVFRGQRAPEGVTVIVLPESESSVQTAKGAMRIVSPQWDRFALAFSYGHGGDTLAAVCNTHPDKPATVLVQHRRAVAGDWQAYDPVTRQRLVPAVGSAWTAADLAAGLHFEVPSLALGMLVLSRESPPAESPGTVSEASVRERLAARMAEAQSRGGAGTSRAGRLTIDWQDLDADGNADLHVASADQDLGFAPSGALWSWRARGHGPDVVGRFDGAGVCQDRFWWPAEARSADEAQAGYALANREIKAGRAALTFRRALTHWAVGGLVVEKTYTIPEEGLVVQVTVTVRNESPLVHEFSYWSHGALSLGALPVLSLPTAAGEQRFAGPAQPREVWAAMPALDAGQRALLGEPLTAQLAASTFALGPPDGPRVTVTTGPDLLQVYRWWDGTDQCRYTLEWMYCKQRLDSGQSWTTRFDLEILK
jgi:hypothetical protein